MATVWGTILILIVFAHFVESSIYCSAPVVANRLVKPGERTHYYPYETVTITCSKGFDLIGSSVVTCGSDGQWLDLPDCCHEEPIMCSAPPVANRLVKRGERTQYEPQEKVTIICNKGFFLNGSPVATCGSDGQWLDLPECCYEEIKLCSAPAVPNRWVKRGERPQYEPQETFTITCNKGFELVGSSVVTCGADGQWLDLPECLPEVQIIYCSAPAVANRWVKPRERTQYEPQDTVTIMCKDGFDLIGSSVVTCGADGQWLDLPVCRPEDPKIFCSAPAVENRLIRRREKSQYEAQETVTIICRDGFELIGSSVVTCGSDGQWVDLPVCQPEETKIYCSAPVVANRLVKRRERNQYDPQDTFTIICSKGYDLVGSSVVTCGSDGQWLDLPECRPEGPKIYCSAPDVANRVVKRRERTQYDPQYTFTIVCSKGFDLIGSSVVTCGPDGQWLDLPECRPEGTVIYCSAPVVENRLVKRRERTQYEPLDTVTIICSKGFYLNGSSVATCGADGQWLDLPECLPEEPTIFCSAPVVENRWVKRGEKTQYVTDDTVTILCREGFDLIGSSVVTCGSDGQWLDLPVCQPEETKIYCSAPVVANRLVKRRERNQYDPQDTFTIICSKGYELIGSSVVTCGADGQWLDLPECRLEETKTYCSAPVVANRLVKRRERNQYEPQDTFTIVCSKGFELVGSSVVTCGSNGQWLDLPECRPEGPKIYCSAPDVANRLVKRRERTQYDPQYTFTIICSKGFDLIGSSVVTCGADGQWLDLPECRPEEPTILCSAPDVTNRVVKRREKTQYVPQDTFTIICSKGFYLIGSSVVTCGSDGQWLDLPECQTEDQIIFCSAPVVANRWVKRGEKTQYVPEDTFTITCNEGFDLIGSSVVTCGSDGQWVDLPECVPEEIKTYCSAPVVENRWVKRRERTQYDPQDTFTIVCSKGFELVGSSVVTCGSNGQWLDLPVCQTEETKTYCSAPVVANRLVKRRERNQYEPQDTFTIICSKGYYLIGSSVVTCGSDGQWLDLPECRPEGPKIYCSAPDVANRLVKRREMTQYDPQYTFTITCSKGYDLIGSSVVTCGSDGQWLDLPECRPEEPTILCSAPDVTNRVVKRREKTQYVPQDTFTIICSKGFYLIGSSVVTCGSDGQWLDLPECQTEDQIIFCSAPVVANRWVKRGEKTQYVPEDTFTITCNEGFDLIGSSVVTCGSDGQWVDLPECVPEEIKIYCSAPVVENRWVKRRERTQYDPQDTFTIVCSKGFELVGSSVVTCGSNGQWLDLPVCQTEETKTYCSAPVVANRLVKRRERNQYEPQDTFTIICSKGFELIGSSLVTCGSNGQWLDLPECRPEGPKIYCSAPDVANRLVKRREKTQYDPQYTFTIICSKGYDLIGSPVATCGPDGQWLDLPECRLEETKIFCSAPVVANRLVRRGERTQYDPQDTETIICSKGFYLNGSSVVTCGSDGQWLDLPECLPEDPTILCSAPVVANRWVNRREKTQYVPQDTVTITCNEGFDLIGSSVVTCGYDGQWLNLPECQPEDPKIFCSAPVVANRLVRRGERPQYDPQDKVTIICIKGFDLFGSSVVTCGADGQWLDLPECHPEETKIFCSPPAVANRLVKRRERPQYEPQDTFTIICSKGYELIGSSVVTCGSDGHWLNLPECHSEDPKIFCSPPVVPNRWVKRRERTQYEPQDTKIITCNEGFDLIGSSVVTCGSDGQWLDLPVCHPEGTLIYCSAPDVANRWIKRGERTQYEPQDKVTIICSKGFDLIGSSVVTCGSNGQWLDLPECQTEETMMFCSAPVVANRWVIRRERNQYEPQETVTITCNEGFDLIGSPVVTCGSDGQWLDLPECRPEGTVIYCSAPAVTNRWVKRGERTQYDPQEKVTIICNKGFDLIGSSVVTCGADGQWLDLPECLPEEIKIFCSAPVVANRLVKRRERPQYEPQDTATIICSKGFDLIGSSVVTCGADGQWLNLPECHPEDPRVFCPPPAVANRLVKRRERPQYEPQDTATIICSKGYELIGSSVVTCGSDGQWVDLPECRLEETKIFCSAPVVANRLVKRRERNQYEPQDTATIICSKGYDLVGSSVVTCGTDGQWLNLPECVPEDPIIFCSAPVVENRWVNRRERTQYEPQETVTITCKDGFDLIGSSVVTCGSDGHWVNLPECRVEDPKIFCSAPVVANRLIRRREKTQYEHRDTFTIICGDGYELIGSSVVTCGSDGQWLDLPLCHPEDQKIFCSAPDVANRVVKRRERTQYDPQDTVTIVCSKGFYLIGSSVVTCGSNGQWVDLPVCQPEGTVIYCSVPDVANRLVKRRERPQYEPQDTFTIICREGFDLIGSSVVTCGLNGQWLDLPECRPEVPKIFCSAPSVANRLIKRVERTQYDPLETETIICSKGFDLIGSSVVTCGADGQWLDLPECRPEEPIIFCSSPVVANRWVKRRERTQYEPQETVTIACREGFYLVGSPVITCGSDGQWVNLPECVPEETKTYCSAPVVANRLVKRRERNQYEPQDTFTIICSKGYDLIGSSVVTCGSNGQWLDLPECVPEETKIFCSPPVVEHRLVKRRERPQYEPQDTFTIICSKGFDLIGSSVVTCGADGQWVDLPVCHPEEQTIFCSAPAVENRLVKRGERMQYEPQDTVIIICKKGFDLIGSSVVTCGLDGHWLNLPECVPEEQMHLCSAPVVPNRWVKRKERMQYEPQETVTIICRDGFDLIGSSVVTCGSDGQWVDLPVCQPEDPKTYCLAPVVANRLVRRGERPQYDPQDTFTIICSKGYDLIGSSVVTCGADGHWLDLPECRLEETKIYCSAPVVPHRLVKRRERLYYEPQDTVTIICRKGYDLIGSSVVTCGPDGQWLNLPECRHEETPIFCSAPFVANRLVDRDERPQYEPQETVTITCRDGFYLTSSSVVTCGSDGQWLNLPECIYEDPLSYCSAPDVANRLVKHGERTQYEPQDTVTIICSKGFDLIGSPVVTCGSNGQWLDLPECHPEETPIFCSAPDVPNRWVKRRERTLYEPQETVTIICRDGFYLIGSSVVTCGPDGQWLNLPECIYEEPKIFCSAPAVANRWIKPREKTLYKPQETVTITCNQGFELIGSLVVTCGPDGHWLDLPVCRPEGPMIYCSAPAVTNRWVKRGERTHYEPQDTFAIICRDRFDLIGSPVVTCGADGQWLDLPECRPEEIKIYCPAPVVANRLVKRGERTQYEPKETVTIFCRDGYDLYGSSVVTCGSDGQWLDLPDCCHKDVFCPALSVANRWVKSGEKTQYKPQETVTIICSKGYHLVGSSVVTCGADGQWSHFPECRL